MITEADTCRKYVLPKLIQAGWDDEPHSFTEQKTFTDGRIVVAGNKTRRRPQKRADYLLRNKTLAGPDLTERLELVLKSESVFAFTLDELDELVGYMPATLQEKGTLVNPQPLFNPLHAAF